MNSPAKPVEYRFAGYRLDPRKRTLHAPDGNLVTLSYRAFDTLVAFASHPGQTLSKSFLMDTVWPNQIVEDNNLSQAIVALRRALGDHSRDTDRMIMTLPGKGYCFTAEVKAVYPGDDSTVTRKRRWHWPTPLGALAFVLALLAFLPIARYFGEGSPATAPALQPVQSAAARTSPLVDVIPDSIAVMPFTNLSGGSVGAGTSDEDQRLFAVSLHDAIINQLAKVRSLNVIARNSVVSLVNQGMGVAELGRVLRVESVMTGTLLMADHKARINLQLIEPATGITFWSGSFEADTENLRDMISIQSEIALNVASRLAAEIDQSEREEITAIPTESIDAYQYNQAAKIALYRQDLQQNWKLSRLAIEHDPNYYDALYTFAAANMLLISAPLEGYTGREHAQMVLDTADAMIRIDPDNTQGFALRALALGTRKEWHAVGDAINEIRAMEGPPGRLTFIAMLLLCFGHFDAAIDIYNQHLLTEPLDLFGRGLLMTALELTGQREAAREQYRLGEQLYPTWWGDNVNVLLSLGRGEPLRDVNQLEAVTPRLREDLLLAGNDEAVRRAVRVYRDLEPKIPAEALYYAALAASVDERDVAVDLMNATVEDAWTSLFWFWLPVFDEVRQESGFHALIERSGITEYWRAHGWPVMCDPDGASFRCDWRAYP